jgi:subtilase family serine protease
MTRLSQEAAMNHQNGESRGPRCAAALTVAAAVAMLAAGCGVVHVHVGSSAAHTRAGPATYRADLAFAQCMRSHGEPHFPDPIRGEPFTVNVPSTGPTGAKAGPYDACKHLLPSGSATAPPTTSAPGVAADCLTSRPPCYAPRQFRVAYGIQPLLDRGITGRGITVVLPEEAETGPEQLPPVTGPAGLPPAVTDIRQDLADFDSRFGLPLARIQVITTLAGPSASPWLAGPEEVGDTELVHAVAPDATIRELLVDPADVRTPAKLAATFATYVRIAARNGQVISQSGIGQHFNVGEESWTSAEVAAMNSALEYAAARHVTVIAASGDNGALGNGSTTPVEEVNLPASDPLVLAAGGTSLTANPVTGAYISETAWNGSGGGFSHLFARPAYQAGVPGIAATRGVPDVAADASSAGHSMALAFSKPGGGYELIGPGGTSAAAPFWAGLIALADQQAGHPLGFVNPAIYRIARGPMYHKAFHDITTGSNTVVLNGVTITGYQAGPGWDPVTGWGTPDAQVLIPLLAG